MREDVTFNTKINPITYTHLSQFINVVIEFINVLNIAKQPFGILKKHLL